MEKLNVKFKTVRQTAAMGFASERQIRLRIAQGKCPGIMAGNRFMVNVDAFMKMLEQESLEAVKQ